MLLKYPIQPTSSSAPSAAPAVPVPLLLALLGTSLFGGWCIVEVAVIWDVCLQIDKTTTAEL